MPSSSTSERRRALHRGARQVLRDGWGIRHAHVRLVKDRWNAVFDVRAGTRRFLLRLHSPEYHAAEVIEAELTWLDALRADGFATPRCERSHEREGVHRFEAPALDHRSATLLGWIPGRRVSHLRHRLFRALGGLMAGLHEHSATWNPPEPLRRPTIDSSTMSRYLFHPHDDRGWRGLDAATRALFDDALARMGDAESGEESLLIHADLHGGNLLRTSEGLTPIDFDDCGYGSPLLDLAIPLATAGRGVDSPEGQALVAGYRSVRPLSNARVASIDAFIGARTASVALSVRGWVATHGGELTPRVDSIVRNAADLITSLSTT